MNKHFYDVDQKITVDTGQIIIAPKSKVKSIVKGTFVNRRYEHFDSKKIYEHHKDFQTFDEIITDGLSMNDLAAAKKIKEVYIDINKIDYSMETITQIPAEVGCAIIKNESFVFSNYMGDATQVVVDQEYRARIYIGSGNKENYKTKIIDCNEDEYHVIDPLNATEKADSFAIINTKGVDRLQFSYETIIEDEEVIDYLLVSKFRDKVKLKSKNPDDFIEIGGGEVYSAIEKLRYNIAKHITSEDEKPYESGYWRSIEYSFETGKFWTFEETLNNSRTWRIVNAQNYTDIEVNNKTFSLIVWSMALSELTMFIYHKKSFKGKAAILKEVETLHKMFIRNISQILNDEELEHFNKFLD